MSKTKGKTKKEGGFSKAILIGMFIFLFAFVVAVFIVFNASGGSEPSTLITAVFAFCGLEGGILGWIKTYKERQKLNDKLLEATELMRQKDAEIEGLKGEIESLKKSRFPIQGNNMFCT